MVKGFGWIFDIVGYFCLFYCGNRFCKVVFLSLIVVVFYRYLVVGILRCSFVAFGYIAVFVSLFLEMWVLGLRILGGWVCWVRS